MIKRAKLNKRVSKDLSLLKNNSKFTSICSDLLKELKAPEFQYVVEILERIKNDRYSDMDIRDLLYYIGIISLKAKSINSLCSEIRDTYNGLPSNTSSIKRRASLGVFDMNISWNYTKCPSSHFDYCGEEDLEGWLREQGVREEEIPSCIDIADEYLVGLAKDGRDMSCCIWFD